MISIKPEITIGIPTYEREKELSRALKSILSQDYKNFIVVIADNSRSNKTEMLCKNFLSDKRFKYFHHKKNIGSMNNFAFVLRCCKTKYFMWLGDDDRISKSYISKALRKLNHNEDISLVGAMTSYYRGSKFVFNGNFFSILQNLNILRVINYYAKVTDNGIFYGVMRAKYIKKISIPRNIGGDWQIMANMIFFGKLLTLKNIKLKRGLGGASSSYLGIVKSGNLPFIQSLFPMTFTAYFAACEILTGKNYLSLNFFIKYLLAFLVFSILLLRPIFVFPFKFIRKLLIKPLKVLYKYLLS
jgi:glycosyltransferase involved in cell wall biosynthesis